MLDLPTRVADSLLQLLEGQRVLAHLVIDEAQMLVQSGGHLAHYGLGGLRSGVPASDQLPFLEGLLPLVETPFLIRSLEMPSGRVADVHFFADDSLVWVLLLDVTAEWEEARLVQQKAYDMTLLSQREARLIAQLEAANEQLTRAHRDLAASREALQATHDRLQHELRDAERYVRATLPEPLSAPLDVDWRFVPSTELGGDSFGYHWVDDEHFALYLIDVCGHGVGSSLLAVAVANTLRSEALARTDFHRPGEVLAALNQAYQMERHGELFSTVWYGVYHRASGQLRYASAGHPPALLVNGAPGSACESHALPAGGPCIGIMPAARYQEEACTLQAPARLFVFSDGTYEITRPDGSMQPFSVMSDLLARPVAQGRSELDELLASARDAHGPGALDDDFTIIRMAL
ncbi:Serine phosphatase RsbU, regulator of sigma subunit [Variovorax sp. HW608]|uniref:PP2C family protein-serine/threonine phosphatase n=1 Tax=Variovorax sp. HW608 TaxID=1034889 RepID=UPI0008200865|nr:SpoIIE family protein phosphatase [Variovorax sp. HW608]SCK46473.1 Serine phosphatase RsbU, regulator of sigma subunit [Variovorax sp. HW608]